MVPYPEDDKCIRAAFELAFEDVHSQPRYIKYEGLLNSRSLSSEYVREYYKIVPHYVEIGNNMSEAIHELHQAYFGKDGTKTACIGPPYKPLAYNVIEYTSVLGSPTVSYADVYEPVEPYYVFFAPTPPSINHQFKATVALMDYFQWKRFGILYDFSDERYRKNPGTLRESFALYSKYEQTDVLTEQGIWSHVPDPNIVKEKMEVLQHNDRRIVLALVGVKGARLVFCEAFHRRMYKPKAVWVLFEHLPTGWAKPLKSGLKDVNCTEEQLLTAADGHIFVVKQTLRKDNVPNLNGLTAEKFSKRVKEKVGSEMKCSNDHGYAYDTVWVLTKSFHDIAKQYSLTHHDYYNYGFSYHFPINLKTLQFEGITGHFEYEEYEPYISKRLGQIAFYKYRKDNSPIYLGVHFTKENRLETVPNMSYILFGSDKNIPKDKAVFRYIFSNFETPLWISLWFISFLGILVALVFLMTTVVLSKRIGTKLRTPILNCVIILGSILCYASVVIYSLDTRIVEGYNIPKVCFAFLSTLTIGFTMTFGGIFAKTWGLYRIFITPSQKDQQSEIKVKLDHFCGSI